MLYVFVVDTAHHPLDPVHPGHARRLLAHGQAAVWKRSPFTLLLKRAVPEAAPQRLRLTIDPGSRTTGLALLTKSGTPTTLPAEEGATGGVVWAGELHHRGHVVHERLQASGLPVETGTGGRTKWNRSQRLSRPKTHWLDAACVGASTPERRRRAAGVRPLLLRATGRHARQLCRRDRCGFPRSGPKATSVVGGLRTGELVQAVGPPPSVQAGVYVGRLAVRASGNCNSTTAPHGVVQGIAVRHCHLLQRSDGYRYGAEMPQHRETEAP